MKRTLSTFLVFLFLSGIQASVSLAQQSERRVVLSQDADYFGGDYDILKDVTIDACQAACLDDGQCQAFTYNVSAGWCFLKSSVGELRSVAGAISGQLVVSDAADPGLEEERRAELAFLPKSHLDEADQLFADIQRRQTRGLTAPAVLSAGRAAVAQNDPKRAAELFRDAAALDGTSFDTWQALMGAVYGVKTNNWQEQRALDRERVSVAVNLYLRGRSAEDRALALQWIGRTLGDRRIWKPAIRAYRASLALNDNPRVRAIYEETVSQHGFRLLEHRVDSDAAAPQICLVFSDELQVSGQDAADFVRVEGGDNLAVGASAREICIDGVRHGERYAVNVRAGLPAADGETIEKSIPLDIYVRDRQPSVRFPGTAYVLPGHDDATIPVATVNTDTINAKLYRIGDRALVQTLGDGQFLAQLNAYQGERIAEQTGQFVWEGTVEVEEQLNTEVVSAIPVSAITAEIRPGAYVLIASAASDAREWEARATQWFIVTDLGLSALSGSDGFHAVVRSLTSAAPIAGVELRLVAKNNQVLATAVSDENGRAAFDAGLARGEGGLAPAMLVAEKDAEGGDYSFLDLTHSQIDLTDRGVEGREPPGPIDVYLTVDRGIYRPGEIVHASALVRDATADAVDGLPLTLIVHRPDGKEAERRLVGDQSAGGSVSEIAIAGNAMRGSWRVGVYSDPEGAALAEASYLVEDFLPERLDFEITTNDNTAAADQPLPITIDARFLYGAPASGLSVSGRVSLAPVRTLDAFPGYVFGLADEEDQPVSDAFDGTETDENGHVVLEAALPSAASVTRPLKATVFAQIADTSGRPVERSLTLPVMDAGRRLGLRPLFDGAAGENSSVQFDAIAVSPAEIPADLAGAEWTLSKVETDYQWYRNDGRWNYKTVYRKRRIANGTVDLVAGQPARIDAEVEWGGYELTLQAGGRALPVSHRFNAGWYVEAKAIDTPETLKVSLDKNLYALGEKAKVHIQAPFAGRAEIMVVDNRLIDSVSVDVPADGATVELDVAESWGPGAYILASVYRPMDLAAKRMPARAMGLAWAAVDPGDRRIAVQIDAPETARPRGTTPVTVTLTNLSEGERAYVTLAAVDAGILNLTGHEAPDPDGWYFGQRKLGMDIRDFYNQLIDRTQGVAGRVRSGGDASMMRFDGPPPPDTLMAFHSGVVEVDENGRAVIDVPVPDFNGTARLMAMAWSARGVGDAVKETVFRDPVVVTASMPRFLAPGDSSRLLVDIDNVEKLSGEAQLVVSADGGILSLPAADASRSLDLGEAGRAQFLVPVDAETAGDAGLEVALKLPDGTSLTKAINVAVRNNEPETVLASEFQLAPGASLTLDASLADGFLSDDWSATLSASGAGRLNVAGIVRSLDLYPYGCSEQITSRAMPLVYLDDVVLAAGLAGEESVAERVDKAIAQLVSRQSSSGSFGLWSVGAGDLWLDAYVTDFLGRAREKGYSVPAEPFRLALDNLKNQMAYVPDFTSGGEHVAYALYVLARQGEAAISDLRYYAKARLGNFSTPLAKAQIGAALMLYGDQAEADRVFRAALADLQTPYARRYRSDYGTDLRDSAALLTLASEVGSGAVSLPKMSVALGDAWSGRQWHSTQEKAWSLMAAHALMSGTARPRLSLNGEARDGALFAELSPAELDAGVRLENRGEQPVYVTVSRRGISAEPQPAGGNFATIERNYYDTVSGDPVDLSAVEQGARIVAVISVLFTDDQAGRMILDDPLPAGFEIDNPNILRSGDIAGLDWLKLESTTAHTEFRSDRFIVAYERPRGGPPRVEFGYIVRAVSPGSFAHPAAVIEDMYQPERRARTASGSVSVIGPLR
jgi:uncharacterized protein YfaS (alpha-2-macroglobulin family)